MVCDWTGRHLFPILYTASTGDELLDANFARKGFSASAIWPAFLLLPSSLGQDFGSNGPLWSLGYEVIYYALYPAWLALRCRQPVLALSVVPLLCLGFSFLPVGVFAFSVLAHYLVWLAGAALAECLVARRVSLSWRFSSAMAFLAGFILYRFSSVPPLKIAAAALFGAAAVSCFSGTSESFSQLRLMRVFEFLGVRSYTLYIVHFPVVALLSAWVIQDYGGRLLHGCFVAGGALLTMAFGWLCFTVCERHFLHSRIRLPQAS